MQEFEFRAAPLRPVNTWAVKDGHVMRRGGSEALDLSKVQSVTWGDIAYRGTRSGWLDLKTGGERFRIACNDNGGGRDRREFLSLIAAVTDALSVRNPDVSVQVDGGAGYNMAMFVIGVLGSAIGLFFVLAGIMDWVTRGNGLAILGGGFFAVLLGYLAWTYAPWRVSQSVSLSDFKVLVSSL